MPVLTDGLRNLQRQLTEAFPERHLPDGWLGDAAHRSRTSGHNPDDTPGSKPAWDGDPDNEREVRATDVSATLGPGVRAQTVVDHIRLLPGLSTVIRYIIHDGWIYHVRDAFGPRPYDGANDHTEHIHFEGAWSQGADNNDTFDFRLERVPVALTEADKKWLLGELAKIDENVRNTARGSKEFLSDTEKNELVSRTADAVVAKLNP